MHFSYKLFENSAGSLNISTIETRSITFRSPCYNNRQCTPYVITLSPAVYRIEAWGFAGSALANVKPGKGAYAKGIIIIRKRRKIYAYIGTKVGFNAQQTSGGGATDLRLIADNWYNFESLKSRILVAGGGGGTEWKCSAGGNAGLTGTTGYSCYSNNIDDYDTSYYCTGATQTSGGECPSTLNYGDSKPTFKGTFGSSGDDVPSIDLGGMGGGGYYGGGSSSYAGAGG